MSNLNGILVGFLFLAVIGVALGITFGITTMIQNSLNGTLTIPTTISNALDTLANLSGTGLIVAGAVLILTIILTLVFIFGPGKKQE